MNDHPVRVEEALPGYMLCSDCPPIGYPTNKTRCLECPRTAGRPHQIEAQGSEGIEDNHEVANSLLRTEGAEREIQRLIEALQESEARSMAWERNCFAEHERANVAENALTRPDPSLGGREAVHKAVYEACESYESCVYASERGPVVDRFTDRILALSPPSLGMEGVRALLGRLGRVREFVENEVDNRHGAGALMSDYEGEADEALAELDAALASISPSGKGEG